MTTRKGLPPDLHDVAMKKGRNHGDHYIGAPKSVAGFREVPIDADLAEVFRAYWDALPKRRKGEGWLFPSKDGTVLDGTNLRTRVSFNGLARRLAYHATNGRRCTIYATPLPPLISMNKVATSNG